MAARKPTRKMTSKKRSSTPRAARKKPAVTKAKPRKKAGKKRAGKAAGLTVLLVNMIPRSKRTRTASQALPSTPLILCRLPDLRLRPIQPEVPSPQFMSRRMGAIRGR